MNVHKLELCLAELVRRLRSEAETRAAELERRIVTLEMRDLDNPMSAAQYRTFCQRVQAPLRLGMYSPAAHSSWRGGGGHAGRHPQ
jgi:hypothetical protein